MSDGSAAAMPPAGGAPDVGHGILYTVGYGNAPPEAFVRRLAEQRLDLALDIRLRPSGWHGDYTGERFLELLRTVAGAARWTRRLGNLGKFDGGEMRLADPSAVDDLVGYLARGKSVVIICGCRTVGGCHRKLVAELVSAKDPRIEIRHLEPPARD